MHGTRRLSIAASDKISTAELPAPTTSTRLPLTCSFDFTSWECSISPSNMAGIGRERSPPNDDRWRRRGRHRDAALVSPSIVHAPAFVRVRSARVTRLLKLISG